MLSYSNIFPRRRDNPPSAQHGLRLRDDQATAMKRLVVVKRKQEHKGQIPLYTIIFACVASLLINWYVVLELNKRIDVEVREEANRELQQTSALFADQISNSMNSIDATLRMGSYLLSEGSNHLDTLIEKKVISLEPLVLLTYVGTDGRAIETNAGMDPDRTDLSHREAVRVHLDNNFDGLFIGKPVIGLQTQSWVFHLSRKVSNPDGSLRGVLVASVNPYYFACFWDELLQGDRVASLEPAVSLYGFDGVIRTGSRQLDQYLADAAPQEAIMNAANAGLNGRFQYDTATGPRDSHFTKMMDKPLIAVASYSAMGLAARGEQQQQEPYLIGALISAIILATGSILLFAMNTCRINEKRASAAEMRLASALDAIKDSFAIYDSEGHLSAYNKAFSSSFNQRGGAADLEAINAYLRNDNGPSDAGLAAAVRKRRAVADNYMSAPERKNEINIGNGRWLRVESTQTPIGETVVYGADISESRRREAALLLRTRQVEAQAQKMKELAEIAESAAKVKSTFLAAMSHELRTPLNAINGFAQVLGKTVTAEEPVHITRLINQSCRHLLDIVDDILDFTRLEADRVTLHPSRIALHKLFDELIETASILTKDKPVKAHFSLAPDVPLHITTDLRRLKQVLLNLVSNAAKFTEAGEIRLIAVINGDMIRFDVSDSGEGIAPSVGASIFEPFEQGSMAQLRSSGTGLGLAISRRLTHLMGGSISYESRLGEGTTFHVEIPLVSGDIEEDEAPAAQEAEAPLPPLRILVAEDAPSSRMLLRMMLTRQGHTVDDVDNGKKALEALLKNHYDLAILDVQMPVMGGPEAAEKLRASTHASASLPLIALTAQVLDEEVGRIGAAGFDLVLGKPFMEGDLEAGIRKVLKLRPKAQQAPLPVAVSLHSPVAPELVDDKDA